MDIIIFHKQSVNENKAQAEATLSICEAIPALEKPYNKALEAYNNYVDGIHKDVISTKKLQDYDLKRDELYRGYVTSLRAELKFPHTSEAALETLLEIAQITKKYKLEVAKLPRDEETAAIDNFLDTASKIDFTVFPDSGITRWHSPLSAANDAYKQESLVLNADLAENDNQFSATELFPVLKFAMDGLLAVTYTQALYSDDETIKTAYNQLVRLYS